MFSLQYAPCLYCYATDGIGNWTSRGCIAELERDTGRLKCSCNHLTNFAALVVSKFSSPANTQHVKLTIMVLFGFSSTSRMCAQGLKVTVNNLMLL